MAKTLREIVRCPHCGKVILRQIEIDILRKIMEGKNYTEIGKDIGYSPVTVKKLLTVTNRKLGARNTINAVAIAMEQGLLVDRSS